MIDMRVRQIALVARDLDPVLAQLDAVFGLKVGFRDPGVGVFGLINAVMPVGGEFLEVVQPVRDDASAARYLNRRGGDAGYMVIFQAADALAHRARLAALGVRLIAESHHDGYIFTHFHPGDSAGVLSSIDTVENDPAWREPRSKWPPAGRDWRDFPAERALGIAAVDIQARDPKAAAERWSELFEAPNSPANEQAYARGVVRFVGPRDADGTGVIGLDIEVEDPAANLAAARRIGLAERDGAVLICGTWMKPVAV
jgi:hypothetical protein